MSYRKALAACFRPSKRTFGAPLVETTTGGSKGGGARLGRLGRTVVARYRSLEGAATKAALRDFRTLVNKAMQKMTRV